MISVLLIILKLVGMLLAILLGMLVLLLLFILFVPVRYHVQANRDESDGVPVHLTIKVSWLLHLLNGRYQYPEEAFLRIRILCFTIYNSSVVKEGKQKPVKILCIHQKECASVSAQRCNRLV